MIVYQNDHKLTFALDPHNNSDHSHQIAHNKLKSNRKLNNVVQQKSKHKNVMIIIKKLLIHKKGKAAGSYSQQEEYESCLWW